MTSVSNVQSFREAYEAYKTSYTSNKGRESLSHYSDSAKAYQVFKQIGKELQGKSSHLEPKQKRIVSQVLQKIRQVRHSQKKDFKAFSEKMSASFKNGVSIPTSFLTTPIPSSSKAQSSSSSHTSSSSSSQTLRSRFIFETSSQKVAFDSESQKLKPDLEEILEDRFCQISEDFAAVQTKDVKQDLHRLALNQGYGEGDLIVRQLVNNISRAYSFVETGKITSEKQLKQELTKVVAETIQRTYGSFEREVVAVFAAHSKTPKEFVRHLKVFQKSLCLSDEDLAKIGNHRRLSSAARDFLEIGVSGFVNGVLRASFPMIAEYFPKDAS
ncbi:MAG: hypothetical protein K2P51_02020 [Rhabdochlamydiaceae bacterium]|nr:hypothetical protein [Rhabdochlamydiaceae bacterium]